MIGGINTVRLLTREGDKAKYWKWGVLGGGRWGLDWGEEEIRGVWLQLAS